MSIETFVYDALIVSAVEVLNPFKKHRAKREKGFVFRSELSKGHAVEEGLSHFADKLPFAPAENAGSFVKVVGAVKLAF